MNEKLARCPVVVEIPVAWGELDSMNHVNGVVYFRYFETARIQYFVKMGYLAQREQMGNGPILQSVQCTYKVPLTYPDTISVGARVTRVEADRFMMAYVIYSHKLQRIAAEGEGTVVAYNYVEGHKMDLPHEMKERIKAIEAAAKSA